MQLIGEDDPAALQLVASHEEECWEMNMLQGAVKTFIQSFIDGPGKDTLAKNRTAVVEVTYDEVISSSAVIVTFTTILLPVGLRLAEHLLKHFSCIRHITVSKPMQEYPKECVSLLDEPVRQIHRENRHLTMQDDKERRILLGAIILLERQTSAAERTVRTLSVSVQKAHKKVRRCPQLFVVINYQEQ
ncbi:hypothetical protein NP493_364g00017 [Ridgeia piscesae]|uniref:Uncharacterized protein n=1 Tax=Ridgeia piscesae TaxID=27915 RepID=A0AAD9NTF2_RIDPI|nr:hypothetical protein NP493_364g00017 [Ridgeia piscesae]